MEKRLRLGISVYWWWPKQDFRSRYGSHLLDGGISHGLDDKLLRTYLHVNCISSYQHLPPILSQVPRLFIIDFSPSLRVRLDDLLTTLLADYISTSSPSHISRIDGQDFIEFLEKEADRLAYHDPDTRWNALFYRLAAQTYGSFTSPRWYPGPTTTLIFENGTEQTRTNRAILIEPSAWSDVSDGDSFYSTMVDSTAPRNLRREETLKTLPHISKCL